VLSQFVRPDGLCREAPKATATFEAYLRDMTLAARTIGKFAAMPFVGLSKNAKRCHSEERSDKESLLVLAPITERLLATFDMTTPQAFLANS